MHKPYLRSALMSMPTRGSPTPKPLLHNSHSQKLDALLDELEIEYGIIRKVGDSIKSIGSSNSDGSSKSEYENEMDPEEFELWEIAKSIKKHNASYRKASTLLKELQKQQRSVHGLVPASVTISATSCSTLEPGDDSSQPRFSQEVSNRTQTKTSQTFKTSELCIPTKQVTFNSQDRQRRERTPTPPTLRRIATLDLDKSPDQPQPSHHVTFAAPTLSSTAKVRSKSKSKSNLTTSSPTKNPSEAERAGSKSRSKSKSKSKLTMSCPMQNQNPMQSFCDARAADRDSNFNVKSPSPTRGGSKSNAKAGRSNATVAPILRDTKKQQQQQPGIIQPSKIPKSISRNRITAIISDSNVVAQKLEVGPPPLPPMIVENVEESSPIPPPPPLPTPLPLPKYRKRSKSKTTSTSTSGEIVPSQALALPNKNQPRLKKSEIDALGIIRDLLEHAKTAATTLFDLEEPDGYYTGGSATSDATYTLEKKASVQLQTKVAVEAKLKQEFINHPQMKMIFGVPYIPGASKIPKPAFMR